MKSLVKLAVLVTVFSTLSVLSMETDRVSFESYMGSKKEKTSDQKNHDLFVTQILMQAHDGNLKSQRQLCELTVNPQTTEKQKIKIVSALYALSRSDLSAQTRHNACCALGYIYATNNGPYYYAGSSLKKATNYFIDAFKIMQSDQSNIKNKSEFITILNKVLSNWYIIGSHYKNQNDHRTSEFETQYKIVKNLREKLIKN